MDALTILSGYGAAVTDSSTGVLLQYGIAGVAIIGEAIAIMILWKYVQSLITLLGLEKDARIQDAKDTIDKIEQPLKSLAQSQQLMADKFTAGRRRS